MDRIILRGVRVYGRHGANPGERDVPQPFDVNVSAEIDLHAAAASDNLDDTLDYAALHARIVTAIETTSYALLERLASDVLDAVFSDHRVARAEVTIAKPGLLGGATPAVTLVRENTRHR
jgi:7,8-dihydroneopterin aldolase/epimerase/oxygenase